MRVFQVITERLKKNSNKIEETVRYITSEENTLDSVVKYFTKFCEHYEEDLKCVREILVIVQHLTETSEFLDLVKNENPHT